MADQLAALAQAYAATGAEMPEDLKAAMEAAGLTVLPTQLEVLKESRDYLKQIAGRMGGAEGYASGGIGNFGRETWVPLHGREAIVPLDRPSRVATGGTTINVHGTTNEANYTLERIIERGGRPLATIVRCSVTFGSAPRVADEPADRAPGRLGPRDHAR